VAVIFISIINRSTTENNEICKSVIKTMYRIRSYRVHIVNNFISSYQVHLDKKSIKYTMLCTTNMLCFMCAHFEMLIVHCRPVV